tara:strand:+ start:13780 stop:15534 length:1755 start_codon:yes stop_codon:yes gene_type:complete
VSIVQFGLALFKRYPTLFIGNLILAMILVAVDAATLASIAPIVSILTQDSGSDRITPYVSTVVTYLGLNGNVTVYLSIFVCLTISNSLLLVTINYLILRAQFIVRHDMIIGSAERVLKSNINFIEGQRQGDVMNTLTVETSRVTDAFTALTRMIAPVSQVFILMWIPLFISWEVTAIAISSAAIMLIPLRRFRARVYECGRETTNSNNEFSTALQEMLQNARLIIGFANMEQALQRLRAAFQNLRTASIGLQFLQSAIYALHSPIGIIVVFVTFLSGRHFGVNLAEIAVMLYAFNRLSGTVANINQSRSQLISLFPSYEQVMAIRQKAEAAHVPVGDHKLAGLRDGIMLKNVSFSYEPDSFALRGINLMIPAGKMTALVGESGSGKSTLADIIMGIQHATGGQVFLDGKSIDSLDLISFRNRLGYVPQRTSLFHASIRDNIAWAKPDATETEIREACRLANADEFIADLERGLDTIVGDQGVRLSGGQAQRISLARALVRKPTLLVLDEATSALDTKSEKLIQSAIEEIAGQTTFLVIAHRLSTIAKADNIVVMGQGRIQEQGQFDQLSQSGGHFAKLVEMQKL